MKKIIWAFATSMLTLTTGSALAAGTSSATPGMGTFGLNIGFTRATSLANPNTPADFMINGKYFIAKDTAVLAGIGLNIVDSGAAANSKSTDIGFLGGIRKYLKTDELAPFLGGRLQYLSTRQGANDVSDFSIGLEAGAEYYFGKQFSLEGSVGFGYASAEFQPVAGGPSTKATAFGTTSFNMSANFYF